MQAERDDLLTVAEKFKLLCPATGWIDQSARDLAKRRIGAERSAELWCPADTDQREIAEHVAHQILDGVPGERVLNIGIERWRKLGEDAGVGRVGELLRPLLDGIGVGAPEQLPLPIFFHAGVFAAHRDRLVTSFTQLQSQFGNGRFFLRHAQPSVGGTTARHRRTPPRTSR